MNALRSLLFPDWELESLLGNVDPNREDDFSLVVASIQTGQLDEAEEWLSKEIERYPWVLLAAADVKIKMNELAEAGRLLRAVTLIATEARVRLWAWHNLRQLGKFPSPDLARQVLGVIIEVPYAESSDILAAYADGTARYINHQGGMIVWDRLDEDVTPRVLTAVREAVIFGEPEDDHPDDPIPADQARLAVLTPAGIHTWQGVPTDAPNMGKSFAAMGELLRAMVRTALDQRRADAETDDEELPEE